MKILYSHRTASADGQFVHIRALTQALAAEGHDVLICGPEGEARPDQLDRRELAGGKKARNGILRHLPDALYELAELVYSIPAALRLLIAWRKFRPDVIYERYNLYFHAGQIVSVLTGTPLILEVNAPLAEERKQNRELALTPLASWSEGTLWRHAGAVLPVTGVLAERIALRRKAGAAMSVVPNAIDEAFLAPGDGAAIRRRHAIPDSPLLGFTGFVRAWHGVDMALHFLSTQAGRRAHLMIVGDGPHLPVLQDTARALGVADRVSFTGLIQKDRLKDYIAAFDIALQPKVTAYASPLKLFEYMAQGKAIAAPDQANIREIVRDGETACLFQPDDQAAFDATLERLLDEPALRSHLGEAARQCIIDRDMTWRGNARHVIALAEQLRSGHGEHA